VSAILQDCPHPLGHCQLPAYNFSVLEVISGFSPSPRYGVFGNRRVQRNCSVGYGPFLLMRKVVPWKWDFSQKVASRSRVSVPLNASRGQREVEARGRARRRPLPVGEHSVAPRIDAADKTAGTRKAWHVVERLACVREPVHQPSCWIV
jgi:hypothetical protein